MKRILILVVALLFIFGAYFGYKAASKTIGKNDAATSTDAPIEIVTEVPAEAVAVVEPTIPPSALNDIALPPSQQNYLLIHVNDATANKPQLISVWVVFVYDSATPQLMFMPLYPSYDQSINSKIGNSFRMKSNNKTTARFISQIENTYHFESSGYILSDDFGINKSNLWLTGTETANTNIQATTDDEKHAIRANGQATYQLFCQRAVAGNTKDYFAAIDWTQFIPDHFATDLSFETITLITDKVTQREPLSVCNVLSSE